MFRVTWFISVDIVIRVIRALSLSLVRIITVIGVTLVLLGFKV